MLHSLLDIVPKDDGNFYFSGSANGIGEGVIYALIGFAVVFVAIVLIIFIIWLIGLILRKTDNLAFLSKLRIKKKPKQIIEPPVPHVDESVDEDIPNEVKAAIVAAIMAYYDDRPNCEFIVRRIKRIEEC